MKTSAKRSAAHETPETWYIAFEGFHRIASGQLNRVVLKVKAAIDRNSQASILIFDGITSAQVEVDFRGTAEEVLNRLGSTSRENGGVAAPDDPGEMVSRGVGRPKLGVVGREVTLLPRHWDWLGSQPGGASVALRKLVETARRVNSGTDRVRRAREAAYRFMSALAGDQPGFEEATRALFAGKKDRFNEMVRAWPLDVRNHAKRLAADGFQDPSGASVE